MSRGITNYCHIAMKNKEEVEQEAKLNSEQSIVEENAQADAENQALDVESKETQLQAEVSDLKDKYLRLYSDFENYRKRTSKERIDLIKTASEDVLKELIPVVDDFERAFRASEAETDPKKIREGNQLIFHKLVRVLESKGLKAMDDLTGKSFDPDTQEAITQIPAPSDEMKGKIIDVVEKGYMLGDKVVRFAKVVTGA